MNFKILIIIAVMMLTTGCSVTHVIHEDEHEIEPVPSAYVDTWLNLPYGVLEILAPITDGFYSPELSSYSDYLYPEYLAYDPDDLPCYVRTDLNGDYYDDFVFLFSKDEWGYDQWYLTTKMIVIFGSRDGYVLSADILLGTVTADVSVPLEEYWSVYMVPNGTHTYVTYSGNVKVEKTITLDNNSFFLASLDPYEEAIFYADGYDIGEMSVDGLARKKISPKKQEADSTRTIPFNKYSETRSQALRR